ncbi:DNA-binding transcriptional LysR family regulator [Neisseria sp. HSC-16F19]|nr:LysR family transcriptional regulator [Neisseria sp. HSC-16F19]MCP2040779.1 DNA-binding transcriptional LysR family regulator [Neisseria sp. HSC-16F19]
MYSLEQWRIFLSVCETGSFSASARQLGRVQSGISQAVANLEIDVGQELFDRSAHKPVLTPAGRALLPLAQALMLQKNQLDQKIDALARAQESELTLVCDDSLLGAALLGEIHRLGAQYPITNFNILAASTFEAEEMVGAGRAQLGLVYLSSDFKNDFDFVLLGHRPVLTVVSPQHALAQTDGRISAEVLKAHRQLVYQDRQQRELWFSDRISAQFCYANSHTVLLDMAKQGMGWTVIPDLLADAAVEAGELVVLDLDFESSDVFVPVGTLVSRSHPQGPVLHALLQVFRRFFRQPEKQ